MCSKSDQNMDFEEIPKEWLVKKLTLQECELEHTTEISSGDSQLVVPFGYLNDKWVYLKSLMLTNDEIWDFESPQDHWDSICGMAGVALVRNGKMVYAITVLEN